MVAIPLILSIIAVAVVVVIVVVQVVIGRNLTGDAKNLKDTLVSLKEDLERQIAAIEEKVKTYLNDQNQWEISFRAWVQDQLKVQDLKNEMAVQKVAAAIETVAKSRETIAEAFRALVVTLRAAFRAEKSILEQSAAPEEPADSGTSESLQ